MTDGRRLKYEKPVSIDMGRVAPILGASCSVGQGASVCQYGNSNGSVLACQPTGAQDNLCYNGDGAILLCNIGYTAGGLCSTGSGK